MQPLTRSFFATAPKGIEPLLAEELRALGGENVAETRAGVSFSGPLESAYRACLWSRLASRAFTIAGESAEDKIGPGKYLYKGTGNIYHPSVKRGGETFVLGMFVKNNFMGVVFFITGGNHEEK